MRIYCVTVFDSKGALYSQRIGFHINKYNATKGAYPSRYGWRVKLETVDIPEEMWEVVRND